MNIWVLGSDVAKAKPMPDPLPRHHGSPLIRRG